MGVPDEATKYAGRVQPSRLASPKGPNKIGKQVGGGSPRIERLYLFSDQKAKKKKRPIIDRLKKEVMEQRR